MDKQYIAMCDTPEIQEKQKLHNDNRFYVKEAVWGFSDIDAEYRKRESDIFGEWHDRKHPKKPPHEQKPLLKEGEVVLCAEMLGVEDDNDIQVTVFNLVTNYPERFIYLPRQEDIQEMLTSLYTVDGMLADFDELWNDERWADKDSLAKPYPGVQKGQGIWGFL